MIDNDYKGLDNLVNKESKYQTIKTKTADLTNKILDSPYLKAGAVAFVATAALSAVDSVYGQLISQTAPVETYGFLSGMWDGIVWPLNFAINIFSNNTFAADGTGVISEPNSGAEYYLGFFLTGGAEGLLGGAIGGD